MTQETFTLQINRTIQAPVDVLFDAWLDPESIKKWMCPGDGVSVPNPKLEAKVGGQFDFTMSVGDQNLPHTGEYKIIDRPKKLQFTWVSANTNQNDSLVTIDFKILSENKTDLTLTHEFLPTKNSKEDHKGGWSRILECLDCF